jgi:sugar lactone lactonase YvrE
MPAGNSSVGTTIKLRRDTAVNWANANPVLAIAEPGLDTTNNLIKYGDGVTVWANLPYAGSSPIVSGNLVPSADGVFNLGNATNRWRSLYVTGNSIYIGNVTLTTSGNILNIDGAPVALSNTAASFTTVNASGNITSAANVAGNYILGNGALLTGVITSVANINSGTSNVTVVSSGGNVTVGVGGTSNVAVFATTGEYVTGVVSATGNIQGNVFIGNGAGLTNIPAGNIIGGYGNANVAANLAAFGSNPISTTGNVTAGYFVGNGSTLSNITGANVTGTVANATYATSAGTATIAGTVTANAQANITSVGILTSLTVSGNTQSANLLTGGLISAAGNITGGNVNTNILSGTGTTIKSTGSLNLSATGNITVNSTYINGVLDPVEAQDVATKAYVDAIAQGLHIHAAANLASTADLATYTGATVTYNNGASGVGATLSLVGNTLTTLDGISIPASINTRLLIKNQANAVLNGVYNYTSSSLLTRSPGEDTNSELNGGDFLFVLSGATQADSGWVQTTDNVVIGTSNVTFTQFSAAGSYTANTSAGLVLNGSVFSAKTDGVTTAFDGGGNIIVKTSANLTTPNIGAATGTSLSATGNVQSGNVLTGGIISATGNITAGTGNFFIGNGSALTGVVATGVGTLTTLSVTGNTTTGNLLTGGLVSATGTVTGSSFSGAGTGLTGTAASLTVGSATTAGTAGSATTAGTVTTAAQPNITSVGTLSSLTVSGNTTSGNLLTAGLVSATGNLYTSNAVTYSDTSNILGWWWSNSVSISQEPNSTDVQFNSSGNTMYIVGTTGRAVYQYGLSTPWAANTATYASLSANVSAQAASPRSINFNSSGNTMFVLDSTTRAVYQYSISNTSNIATAAYASLSANISAQETTTPEGMTFSPDGANMYIVGSTLDTIYQYSISNTANIATATYASKSLSVATQEGSATGLAFNATGNVLYLVGTSQRVIYQYNLGTPYDISTGAYSGNNLYVGYQESTPTGIYVNLANNAVYINGQTNDRVYQYDTGNSTIINSNSLAVTGYAHFSGNTQLANVYMPYNSTLSVTGSTLLSTTTFNAGITAGATTSTINLGTSLTTGTFTIGGTAQTSNINIGRSANTSAIVIGNGAVLSGNVKTIDIASNGLANSISNITIFGNVAGNSTLTIGPGIGNTTVSYNSNTIVAVANTSGLALSVAGNITGGNISTGGALTAASYSASGNITGGNLLTGGLISATGNITGGNLIGSNLTATRVPFVGTGGVITDSTVMYTDQPNQLLYVGGGGAYIGGTGGFGIVNATRHEGGTVSVTGNITGANIVGSTLSVTGTTTGSGIGSGGITTGTNTALLAATGRSSSTTGALLNLTGNSNPSGSSGYLMNGQHSLTPQGDLSAWYGLLFLPTIQTYSGNISSMYNEFIRLDNGAAGNANITNWYGSFVATPSFTVGSAPVINSWSGYTVQDPNNAVANATSAYGFRSSVNRGTNRWGAYFSGTANNYFAGNVGIGVTSAGNALDVSGNVYVTSGNILTTGSISATGNITTAANVAASGIVSALGNIQTSNNLVYANTTSVAKSYQFFNSATSSVDMVFL